MSMVFDRFWQFAGSGFGNPVRSLAITARTGVIGDVRIERDHHDLIGRPSRFFGRGIHLSRKSACLTQPVDPHRTPRQQYPLHPDFGASNTAR